MAHEEDGTAQSLSARGPAQAQLQNRLAQTAEDKHASKALQTKEDLMHDLQVALKPVSVMILFNFFFLLLCVIYSATD